MTNRIHIDKRIWLADLTYTGENQSLGADTFPLGVGNIASYTESQFSLNHPIRLFKYPEKVAKALEEGTPPDIIGFSNYIWNSRLSLAIAQCIKEAHPDTIIIFGGPNYPIHKPEQEDFLRKNPQIDFYILHEGEMAFVKLLKILLDNNFQTEKSKTAIPSIHSINKNNQFFSFDQYEDRLNSLDEIPSPYTTGKMDEFFDGLLWPLIQTKRGCPFQCTFCTEGLDYYSKIKRFSVGHVCDEINYIGKKMAQVRLNGGRNDLYIADSNFGMFKEDIETAKALSQTGDRYGWPDHINASTGKNQKERVLEAANILDGRIVLSGSVQTLTLDVLENVKRKNISPEGLLELAQDAKNIDANSYSEIILGLPGETRESHFKTLETVINAGFKKVIPYQLMILPGSELGTAETISRFGLKLQSRILPRAFGRYKIYGKDIRVADIEEICVASNSMSFEDYLSARLMHVTIAIFYNDVIFKTVIKTLQANKLSVFRWLVLLMESAQNTELKKLYDEFKHHSNFELRENIEDLEAFIQEPGVIEQHISGKMGFNLLYTFKALALTRYPQAMFETARDAMEKLISESSPSHHEVLLNFLKETLSWDYKSFSNILEKMDDKVTGVFGYNIAQFSKDETIQKSENYKYKSPIEVHFVLTGEQKKYVKRNTSIFGDDAPGIGRLLSNAHTSKMLRHPVLSED